MAWLGNLAGQSAVPVAEVHISCMGTYRVTLAVFFFFFFFLGYRGIVHPPSDDEGWC